MRGRATASKIKFPIDVEGAEYVFFPAVSRLPAGARHPHGQRGGDARHRAAPGPSARRTSTASTTASSTATGCWSGSSTNEVAEVRRLKAQEDPDRRVRPRHALGQGFVPTFGGDRRAAGGQHHGVHLRRSAKAGKLPLKPERHQGAGHLPRPVQHRPQRLDHRAAPRDPAGTSARTSWR